MTVQTIYVLASAAVSPNWFGPTQLNGSAPTGANTAYGWSANKIAVGYIRGRLGATATSSDAVVGSSYNAGTSGPTKGTGSGASTAGDSFIAGPFNGTFAATAWTFAWNLRASTAGCVGHINMRIWKSVNADGSVATQLAANAAGATVTLSTTADVNSSISWSPGALTFNNEYLFLQVEWQETTLGTTNGDNVFFRAGTAAITTADFVAIISGPVIVTQAAQTVSATANTVVLGTLNATQVGQTITATGAIGSIYGKGLYGINVYSRSPVSTGVSGTLYLNQAPQVLAGAAGGLVTGILSLPQASQTLVSMGRVDVSGALSALQAAQTLSAAGSLTIRGTLNVLQAAQALSGAGSVVSGNVGNLNLVQAPQTLAATGKVAIGATLAVVQADQTLAATGTITTGPVDAVLNLTQDDQTLTAVSLILGWGPTEPCSPPEWEDSEFCPPSLWTPVLPPNWELPGVAGAWGVGPYGVKAYQPSSSSPWFPPDPVETPSTWTPSAPPVSVDWQQTEPCDG